MIPVLEQLAREVGFISVGVAPARPAPSRRALLRWLQEGMAAGMRWMRRTAHLRTHPEHLLPGARSVVVFLAPYAPLPGGRIAHYARFQDYHNVLHRRLRRVWRGFLQFAGLEARARFFVDSGPLLERDYATLAGLGFIGKNTMLIHPRWGSYILIAAILTDLELPRSPRPRWWRVNRKAWAGLARETVKLPERLFSLCGSCTRCLDACPTGALRAPGVLDARRCISYQTIENRGAPVPEDLRERMAGYVFGCDICQDVCPWNRKLWERPSSGPLALRIPDPPPLEVMLTMEEDAFRRRFQGTPLRRIRAETLRRNAALAWLDEVRRHPHRGPVARKVLHRQLYKESSPLVREHMVWVLRRLGIYASSS